jgi:hypothetical protein
VGGRLGGLFGGVEARGLLLVLRWSRVESRKLTWPKLQAPPLAATCPSGPLRHLHHHTTPYHTSTWICYKQCAKRAAGTSHPHSCTPRTNTLSSGGRSEFKWEDVKNDAQRENYLGHSLMAPVGRWQQNRDLSWYAKGDVEGKEAEAARIKEEKRKLKEAEEDAMLAAMGLPVPERNNANLTPLGEKAHEADVKDALEEKVKGGEEEERAKRWERKEKERSRRHRDEEGRERRRRHHSRSRSRDHDRSRRHRDRSREGERRSGRDGDRDCDRRRHRSRSREHGRRDDRAEPRRRDTDGKPSAPRDRSRDRRRPRDGRSRSPYKTERRRD